MDLLLIEYMGLAQTTLSITHFQLCFPKSVFHPGQARAMAVRLHRLHSHLNWYFLVAMGTLVLADLS